LIRFTVNHGSPHLYKFLINGYSCPFGYLLPRTIHNFTWSQAWDIDHHEKTVKLLGSSLEERVSQMHATLFSEQQNGTFKVLTGWKGELFPVYGPDKELVLSMWRAGAPLFGIVTYGVQMLAYHSISEGIYGIWIARRAKTKRTYPGMLNCTVGGSMSTGETPFECLVREAEEEASLPEDLVRARAKACGTVNYVCMTDERGGGELGLMCPEVMFTYEMNLPHYMMPTPNDGEAETIDLLTIDEVQTALGGGEFTPTNGCVVIDFFVRHGIITFENEKDYVEIASRLHRCLEFPTM
jgi:8-oxo-dGTP pyrophosphatase MutT (NUDIX family)